MPKFSIICPTLQRQSLIRCVKSVLFQSFTDWEMLIQVDAERIDYKLFGRCSSTRKIWVQDCGVHHNNYGNTCRHEAWERATGEWLIHLDDDNYLADEHVLRDIAALPHHVLMPEDWMIFPILRHGSVFFNDPPGLCKTDTANVVVRREIGRWPDIPDYTADGHWVEGLKKYSYAAYPNFKPIVVMEKSNEGK